MPDEQPFAETLRALLKERDLSNRQFARHCQDHNQEMGPGSTFPQHGTISRYLNGHISPSQKALRVMAAALGMLPEEFPEYRMLIWRERLDFWPDNLHPAERVSRFESAYAALEEIENR